MERIALSHLLQFSCLLFLLAADALSDAVSCTALPGLVMLDAAGVCVTLLCISQQNWL